jgi:hypothetical protein
MTFLASRCFVAILVAFTFCLLPFTCKTFMNIQKVKDTSFNPSITIVKEKSLNKQMQTTQLLLKYLKWTFEKKIPNLPCAHLFFSCQDFFHNILELGFNKAKHLLSVQGLKFMVYHCEPMAFKIFSSLCLIVQQMFHLH